jgi:hypothetical protein
MPHQLLPVLLLLLLTCTLLVTPAAIARANTRCAISHSPASTAASMRQVKVMGSLGTPAPAAATAAATATTERVDARTYKHVDGNRSMCSLRYPEHLRRMPHRQLCSQLLQYLHQRHAVKAACAYVQLHTANHSANICYSSIMFEPATRTCHQVQHLKAALQLPTPACRMT